MSFATGHCGDTLWEIKFWEKRTSRIGVTVDEKMFYGRRVFTGKRCVCLFHEKELVSRIMMPAFHGKVRLSQSYYFAHNYYA